MRKWLSRLICTSWSPRVYKINNEVRGSATASRGAYLVLEYSVFGKYVTNKMEQLDALRLLAANQLIIVQILNKNTHAHKHVRMHTAHTHARTHQHT